MIKNKWLKYFKENFEPDEEFYKEMLKQVPNLFETLMNKKIDWDKVWLFVEPISYSDILLHEFDNLNRHFISLICELKNTKTGKDINGCISWYVDHVNQIPFHSSKTGQKIEFFLKEFEKNRDYYGNIPEINNTAVNEEKFLLLQKNEVKVTFERIDHEGYFTVILNNKVEAGISTEMIKNLNNFKDNWNAISEKQNGGYFHFITFDKLNSNIEDNEFRYYYDMGSANLEAHKYILENLIEINSDIKEIVIEPL